MADTVLWGIAERVRGVLFRRSRANVDTYDDVESRSTDEVIAIVRHEATGSRSWFITGSSLPSGTSLNSSANASRQSRGCSTNEASHR